MILRRPLEGRVAFVTGASSGLGEHFCLTLARAGAKVVLAARRVERLEHLRAAIEAEGGHAAVVTIDVADEVSTIAAFDTGEAAFGRIDTVVANAGTNVDGMALSLAAADFDQAIAVNLRGTFLTMREGARRMVNSGGSGASDGRIVAIASITAHHVAPGLSAYSASKAGVVQFGKVLARELIRKEINVNVICPGYIRTDINREWFDTEAGAKQVYSFPRRRLMEARDLDALLVYLCSDEARAVTGSVFTIDDGQTL